jgi:hypothetical protein
MTDFDRARFRTELLLQLPAEDPSAVDGAYPDVSGMEYTPEALAAWILEQVDLAAATPDEQLGRVVEMAGAASTLKAFVEFARYLGQLGAVLRQGHTLASQTDLARTIEAEASRLQQASTQLVTAYPELLQVEAPETRLVVPGQNG